MSDMPEILKDCGFVVEPDNPAELMKKIEFVLNYPEEAKEIGRKAREKCIQDYSIRVIRERLVNYIQEIVK